VEMLVFEVMFKVEQSKYSIGYIFRNEK
jgi:hypothetical protein